MDRKVLFSRRGRKEGRGGEAKGPRPKLVLAARPVGCRSSESESDGCRRCFGGGAGGRMRGHVRPPADLKDLDCEISAVFGVFLFPRRFCLLLEAECRRGAVGLGRGLKVKVRRVRVKEPPAAGFDVLRSGRGSLAPCRGEDRRGTGIADFFLCRPMRHKRHPRAQFRLIHILQEEQR